MMSFAFEVDALQRITEKMEKNVWKSSRLGES